MANYSHITAEDRQLIQIYHVELKWSTAAIAKRLGHHRSSIYRELNRNTQGGTYTVKSANQLKQLRRKNAKSRKLETNIELQKYVIAKLKKGWSPEQIAGKMKRDNENFYVCHESEEVILFYVE